MVRYVKNEGRPALGFAVESEESDESSDDEPLSDQPSLATLVSENPGSPPDSQAPFVPKSERRRSASRVSFKEDMAFVDRQGYTRDSENLEETVVKVRPLGHGQFGRVWLAFHAPTQRLVALKEVEAQTEKRRKRAVAEISANARQAAPFERRATPTDSHGSPEVSEDVAAWRRDLVAGAVHGCDHVLKFFGSFADPRGETVSLVIEFMDAGSLDQFMGADALSCPKFLQRAAVGALRGLGHLHAHRVVHRDVKPANVLLSRRGDVKVGDLGDAVPEQDEDTNVSTSTPVTLGTEGTLAFFAPERAAGACYGCAADAWALGVTLVAVWTGRLPLVPGNGGLFAFAALVCDSAPPSLDASAPSEALKLVEKLCTKDATVRPSCAALLNEDGFVKAYDWDRGFGDYWAEALRWAPLDGREILEAVSTAVGFATVRAERKQAPRRSQSAPNLMPRRPEPKRRKSFLSITASAAKTLVRRISRRKSKKKSKASEPVAHLASATPTSPLTPTRSPRSPISYVLSAATARLRAKANAKALRDAELYASVGAEESLERDAQRRREEAMQRRRAEKPDLLAAQLAIRQSHRNRRIGESEWVSTAAAVSVDSPVRRHFRGRRGGHGAGGHHDTGWGSQMRRSPTNRASQSSSSGSSQRGPPTRRSADSGRGSFATLPPTRRSGDTGRGTLSSDDRATISSNGTVRRAAATPPTRRSADSGVTFGSMDGSNPGPQEQNSLATLGTTFSKFSVSGVLEGSTADTTLDSVLDQDKLNDTYAIAQELGVGVLEVYDAMTRGEERAAEALDREASRGYDPGDGEDSPPRSSMMRRARSSYTV